MHTALIASMCSKANAVAVAANRTAVDKRAQNTYNYGLELITLIERIIWKENDWTSSKSEKRAE